MSLVNFENVYPPLPQVLSSPRSLEVCRLYGYAPHELLPKEKRLFDDGKVPLSFVERRWQRHEAKRQEALKVLRQARTELIRQEAADGHVDEEAELISEARARSTLSANSSGLSQFYKERQKNNLESIEKGPGENQRNETSKRMGSPPNRREKTE